MRRLSLCVSYIRSGALTPNIFNPWRRTICIALQSARRALVSSKIPGNDFIFVVIRVEHPCKLYKVERDAVRLMRNRRVSEDHRIKEQLFHNADFFIAKVFAVK